MPESCACCGSADLEPHLSVAGDVGEEGLIPTTTSFGRALSDIVRCRRCGHMQLEKMPTDEVLATLYEDAESEDYVDEEVGQRATANAVLDRIERFTAPGAILDVGCWVGFLLSEARSRGWTETGLEPSTWASDYARDRLGLNVRTADLFGADLEPASFNAVFLGDVIEHLTDPGRAIDRAASLLVEGGVLAMALPDAGSRLARAMRGRWWAVVPTHVQYFTRTSMQTLLREHGFEPLLAESQPKQFTVSYYLQRIEGYSKLVAGGLLKLAAWLRIADRLWAPDFGDRMLVVARAPSRTT